MWWWTGLFLMALSAFAYRKSDQSTAQITAQRGEKAGVPGTVYLIREISILSPEFAHGTPKNEFGGHNTEFWK